MNYLSVCSGIEAATVAWHHMGWKPVGFSEIEKFPSQVLAHHYPQVTNFGDMTKYKEWKLDDSIGLLVGGTPCQSFSVAGLRKGLEDPRGNLALTYVGILDKFRPKWCVWENVPGVLSSGGGRDFGAFLGALAELGYGFAYRVLDAQNFGVAQRRRRVFVVGCFGDWRPAAKVLFESESLSGNIKQSRKTRKESSTFVESSFGTFRQDSVGGTTKASGGVLGGGSETLVYENHGTDSRVREIAISPTVTARWGTGGNNVPIALAENTIGRQPLNGGNGTGYAEGGPMYTLNATGVHGVAYGFEPGIAKREGNPARFVENGTPTLRANMGDNQTATAYSIDTYNLKVGEGSTQTLRGFGHIDHVGGTMHNMAVRRLTEVECERLQGFPDNYTNIKENCPSGARYKALGNSMAVPVMKWIGDRINLIDKAQEK
jgi:DNA (cytosine-5)-methyltransferase 1